MFFLFERLDNLRSFSHCHQFADSLEDSCTLLPLRSHHPIIQHKHWFRHFRARCKSHLQNKHDMFRFSLPLMVRFSKYLPILIVLNHVLSIFLSIEFPCYFLKGTEKIYNKNIHYHLQYMQTTAVCRHYNTTTTSYFGKNS